jgi:hypothetical protein
MAVATRRHSPPLDAALLKERVARTAPPVRVPPPPVTDQGTPGPGRGWLPALRVGHQTVPAAVVARQGRETVAHQVWTAKRTGNLSTIGVRYVHLCLGMVDHLPFERTRWSRRFP